MSHVQRDVNLPPVSTFPSQPSRYEILQTYTQPATTVCICDVSGCTDLNYRHVSDLIITGFQSIFVSRNCCDRYKVLQ